MRWPLSLIELVLIGLTLSVLAIVAPLALYLGALILFGLPHVLWELNWLKQTYGYCLPLRLWTLWGAVLGLQALGRLGAWLDWWPFTITSVIDLSALGLLLVLALIYLARYQDANTIIRLSVILLGGASIYLVLQQQSLIGVIMVLALLHNFTPVFLVQPHQQFHQLPTKPVLHALFSLPFIVGLIVWMSGYQAQSAIDFWLPSEAAWLQTWITQGFNALLSGLVLAQCLHYYSVLRLMPSTLAPSALQLWHLVALMMSASLSVYFILDFTPARQLYGVASGIHAWLELPLIVLILSGALQPPKSVAEAKSL